MASRSRLRAVRRGMVWSMLIVLVGSLAIWRLTHESFDGPVRIGTAAKGGRYYQVGQSLRRRLSYRTGASVDLVETSGSLENRELLLSGQVDAALIQLGSVPLEGLAVLAPLYPEVVHVVVRSGRGIESIPDLEGRSVAMGPITSGMRSSAAAVLRHYRVEPIDEPIYFTALETDTSLDAAVVTTGFMNPDLTRLLDSGRFELLPVLDAQALSIRHRFFVPMQIPRGLYSGRPPTPPSDLPSVATVTLLVVAEGASPFLVKETLEVIFAGNITAEIPELISSSEADAWPPLPLHPAARSYHEPYEGLGILANFMETVAAAKELIFALGAGLYLLWSWWQSVARRELEHQISIQKERLDTFLEETTRIEEAQMAVVSVAELRKYLDDVTRIKLRAISELTHEELRGDRMFSIFLQQCSALSRKLEAKLIAIDPGDTTIVERVAR